MMNELPREEPLYRLLYVSKPVSSPGPERAAQIEDILRVSRINNRRTGITGVLVHSANWFGQVLEGPQSVLDRLFEVIQDDPRHRSIRVMEIAHIEQRAFGEWAMGEVDDFVPAQFELVVRDVLRGGATPDPLFFDMTNQFMALLNMALARKLEEGQNLSA